MGCEEKRSIQFKADVHPDYVYLVCTGSFDRQAFIDVIRSAIELAVENDRTAALIDFRDLSGEPTTMERFSMGEAIPLLQREYSSSRLVRLALVAKPPLADPQRFGEIVAVNRGAVGHVFDDMEQAIGWIK